jgi:hypothetical protein
MERFDKSDHRRTCSDVSCTLPCIVRPSIHDWWSPQSMGAHIGENSGQCHSVPAILPHTRATAFFALCQSDQIFDRMPLGAHPARAVCDVSNSTRAPRPNHTLPLGLGRLSGESLAVKMPSRAKSDRAIVLDSKCVSWLGLTFS